MLAEFARDEGFQDPPKERTILLETTGVGTDKVAREPGIHEMDLGSFDQPLAQVGRPASRPRSARFSNPDTRAASDFNKFGKECSASTRARSRTSRWRIVEM